jgi:hypothetical protein
MTPSELKWSAIGKLQATCLAYHTLAESTYDPLLTCTFLLAGPLDFDDSCMTQVKVEMFTCLQASGGIAVMMATLGRPSDGTLRR